MIKNFPIIIILLFSLKSFAVLDFMKICTSKSRPGGFDELIRFSIEERNIKLGNQTPCERAQKKASIAQSVFIHLPIESSKFLEAFPNMNFLDIAFDSDVEIPLLKPLSLANQHNLKTLAIRGNIKLSDFGDIPQCRNLQFVTLLGNGKDSWVDAKALSQLPLLDLEIGKLTLKNAKALENLKDLKKIYLKEVKLDEPINWSSFPNLKSKKLVGVVNLEK